MPAGNNFTRNARPGCACRSECFTAGASAIPGLFVLRGLSPPLAFRRRRRPPQLRACHHLGHFGRVVLSSCRPLLLVLVSSDRCLVSVGPMAPVCRGSSGLVGSSRFEAPPLPPSATNVRVLWLKWAAGVSVRVWCPTGSSCCGCGGSDCCFWRCSGGCR